VSERTDLVRRVEQFLYLEAALLDGRDFDAWLALYDEDAIYSVPLGVVDHDHKVSIAYDDHRRLVERVIRLKSGFAYAQEPPSSTVHLIGNVRLEGDAVVESDTIQVASSLMVTEVRRGHQCVYAAVVRHTLRTDEDSFRIVRKQIRLANAELPLGNLTFLI
jgi:benzoate/toluate 1,2-dioxygenase subunit beta